MSLEYPAFISYAHLDNQLRELRDDKGKGWIDVLHSTLSTMVSQKLGRDVKIWLDKSLQGNTDFTEEIKRKVLSAHVMISVVTPRYVQSPWCQHEVATFCNAAESNGGLFVGTQARVFRVIKTPQPDGRLNTLPPGLPPALGKAMGYEFFRVDPNDASCAELDPVYGDDAKQQFLARAYKLAGHVAALLNEIEQQLAAPAGDATPTATAAVTAPPAPAGRVDPDPARPVIYLTECSRFHRANREQIATELQREGYTVVPDRPLPTDEADLVAEVTALLAKSQLSVHLIGPLYGVVPEGRPNGKSFGVWQNELAAQRAQQARQAGEAYERVIWLAQGTTSDDAKQQEFIDSLHQQKQAQFGADLVTDDIEGFKRSIRDALQRLEQPAPVVASDGPAPNSGADTAADAALVYLVCDERDRDAAKLLLRELVKHGCDATLPQFKGDAKTLREAHLARLASADAVLLFHGAGDEVWRSLQESEIKKAAAQRRDRPWRAMATYVAAPATEGKQDDLDIGRPGLVNGLNGLGEATLTSLWHALGLNGKAG